MKTKIQIKSIAGALLFEYEGESLNEALVEGAKKRADLRYADLRYADLRDADLQGADLRDADLRYADLRCADLQGADLRDADLRYADLQGAKDIPVLALAQSSIVPDSGPFFGWKKCRDGVIVKLAIGAKAKRSNANGRKCRAEYAKVLDVFGSEVGISVYDGKTKYRKGEIVHCDKWNEDCWTECGGGIHFYMTRVEAEAHV